MAFLNKANRPCGPLLARGGPLRPMPSSRNASPVPLRAHSTFAGSRRAAGIDAAGMRVALGTFRKPRLARSGDGIAIARDRITGVVSIYDDTKSCRRFVHAGMGTCLVADEIANLVLSTTLE